MFVYVQRRIIQYILKCVYILFHIFFINIYFFSHTFYVKTTNSAEEDIQLMEEKKKIRSLRPQS